VDTLCKNILRFPFPIHSELTQWQGRSLQGKRYVYFWVDGVYFETRLEEARQCILVIIGADASGQKERVGLWDGYHKSEQSWKELLLVVF
jgi:putative transposase